MTAGFSLTQEQRAEFRRAGMLHIPAHFDHRTMADMTDKVWADLGKRFGIIREDRNTWTTERPAQYQALVRSGTFRALEPGFAAIADALLGKGSWERPHLGQPLVTFPTGDWSVPHTVWHIDLPPTGSVDNLSTIRIFVLFEPVRPKGGGTCYVEGSHHVIESLAAQSREPLRSAAVKDLLATQEPWFAALFAPGEENREQRFMIDNGMARGIQVRVKETLGEAGDVYVMHPAMLHTIAPNALDRPRMMLGQTLVKLPRAKSNVPQSE